MRTFGIHVGRIVTISDHDDRLLETPLVTTRKRNLVVGVSTFSKADEKQQQEVALGYWEEAGQKARWNATCEMTAEWFLLRGIDPRTQRVDKSIGGVLPVPWAKDGQIASDEEESGATV